MDLSFAYKAYCDKAKTVFLCLMQKKKSLIRLNLRLLAEMVGILPQAKQQPAGLIACGLRTAALFSSSPSSRKKGTSLSQCLLLAEMVGFEPTCPIKVKTISSL